MKSFVFITGKAKQFQRWELCSQSVLHCRSECRQGTISCKLAVMWAIALKNSALQSTKVHEPCFPHLTGKIKLQNYIPANMEVLKCFLKSYVYWVRRKKNSYLLVPFVILRGILQSCSSHKYNLGRLVFKNFIFPAQVH